MSGRVAVDEESARLVRRGCAEPAEPSNTIATTTCSAMIAKRRIKTLAKPNGRAVYNGFAGNRYRIPAPDSLQTKTRARSPASTRVALSRSDGDGLFFSDRHAREPAVAIRNGTLHDAVEL